MFHDLIVNFVIPLYIYISCIVYLLLVLVFGFIPYFFAYLQRSCLDLRVLNCVIGI